MKPGDEVKLIETPDLPFKLERIGIRPRNQRHFLGKSLTVTDDDNTHVRVRPPSYDTSFFIPKKWLEKSS